MNEQNQEAKKEALVKHIADAMQVTSKDGNVLVIREGEAEKIKYKNKVSLDGTLSAPSEFFKKRVEKGLHDKDKCHVVFNKNAGKIILIVDEQNEKENFVITGSLKENPDLVAFGINSSCTIRSVKEAMNFLKMNRLFFTDKDLNHKIVASLQNFKAKVEKEIENSNDLRGNEKVSKMQKLETGLAESFELAIPIYKGYPNSVFAVDILCHVNDNGINIYFESRGLKELQDSTRSSMLEEELENFKEIVCIEQ